MEEKESGGEQKRGTMKVRSTEPRSKRLQNDDFIKIAAARMEGVEKWIGSTLKISVQPAQLFTSIRSGVILCHLARELLGIADGPDDILSSIHFTESNSLQRENIDLFLKKIDEKFTLPMGCKFSSSDLVYDRAPCRVVDYLCLLALVVDFPETEKSPFLKNLEHEKLEQIPLSDFHEGILEQATQNVKIDRPMIQLPLWNGSKWSHKRRNHKKEGRDSILVTTSLLKMDKKEITKLKETKGTENQVEFNPDEFDPSYYLENIDKVIKVQSAIRRFQSKQILENLQRQFRHCRNVVFEIVQTEESYVESLAACIDVALVPLENGNKQGRGIISEEDIRFIFSDLKNIHFFHTVMIQDLKKRTASWTCHSCFGDIFIEFMKFMNVYIMYVQNYSRSLQAMMQCKKDKKFVQFLDEVSKDSRLRGLSIDSYLIMPVQRIPRYALLIRDLLKHLPDTHPDFKTLSEALDQFGEKATLLNKKRKEAEDFFEVIQVANRLTWKGSGVEASVVGLNVNRDRLFIKEITQTSEIKGGKNIAFFFNDIIIISVPNTASLLSSKHKLKVKQVFWLTRAALRDLPDLPKEKNIFELVSTGDTKEIFRFNCVSAEAKQELYTFIEGQIKKASGQGTEEEGIETILRMRHLELGNSEKGSENSSSSSSSSSNPEEANSDLKGLSCAVFCHFPDAPGVPGEQYIIQLRLTVTEVIEKFFEDLKKRAPDYVKGKTVSDFVLKAVSVPFFFELTHCLADYLWIRLQLKKEAKPEFSFHEIREVLNLQWMDTDYSQSGGKGIKDFAQKLTKKHKKDRRESPHSFKKRATIAFTSSSASEKKPGRTSLVDKPTGGGGGGGGGGGEKKRNRAGSQETTQHLNQISALSASVDLTLLEEKKSARSSSLSSPTPSPSPSPSPSSPSSPSPSLSPSPSPSSPSPSLSSPSSPSPSSQRSPPPIPPNRTPSPNRPNPSPNANRPLPSPTLSPTLSPSLSPSPSGSLSPTPSLLKPLPSAVPGPNSPRLFSSPPPSSSSSGGQTLSPPRPARPTRPVSPVFLSHQRQSEDDPRSSSTPSPSPSPSTTSTFIASTRSLSPINPSPRRWSVPENETTKTEKEISKGSSSTSLTTLSSSSSSSSLSPPTKPKKAPSKPKTTPTKTTTESPTISIEYPTATPSTTTTTESPTTTTTTESTTNTSSPATGRKGSKPPKPKSARPPPKPRAPRPNLSTLPPSVTIKCEAASSPSPSSSSPSSSSPSSSPSPSSSSSPSSKAVANGGEAQKDSELELES